ncbi:MAG: glucose-1-phosphate thymidylyltransferase [Elusimicrobia bacterium]|nr:glucose-1-phosphate thymidylyltransferase [Elusimicrobiota bacterium]
MSPQLKEKTGTIPSFRHDLKTKTLKALILSGGKGTRLRPLTYTAAKQLLPVANKPILFYGLEAIAAAGIKDVGVIVGDTKQEIVNALGDGSKWGIRIKYIEQEAPLGLAHAVKIAKDFINGSSFVMYLGDNLLCNGITSLVESFRKERPNAQILLTRVKNPNQFGVAELQDDEVIRLEEKPKRPKSDFALVGVYMFDHNIFDVIRDLKPSARGELEITDAIQGLIDRKFKVKAHIVTGWWKDTGKLGDILEANRLTLGNMQVRREGSFDDGSLIEGNVSIAANAKIINSTIRGPVIIGDNTVIIDSYVGPFTSIASHVQIENSEIENSIVLPNVLIRGVSRIESSLIGYQSQVVKLERRPKVYRLMVGDSSSVEIP